MSADFDIDEELGRLGFVSAEARRTARAVLEEARLTRPGRRRMAVEKRDRLRDALEQRFLFLCPECLQEAPNANGRERVAVAPEQCSECGGSANRREAARLAEALRASGKRRLLVVGGSPGTRQDLKRQLAGATELRMIEGSGGVRRRDAERHLGRPGRRLGPHGARPQGVESVHGIGARPRQAGSRPSARGRGALPAGTPSSRPFPAVAAASPPRYHRSGET